MHAVSFDLSYFIQASKKQMTLVQWTRAPLKFHGRPADHSQHNEPSGLRKERSCRLLILAPYSHGFFGAGGKADPHILANACEVVSFPGA